MTEAAAVAAYTGNGAYCFSNGLHMSLLAAGAEPLRLPEPGFLECLSGMAFGRLYNVQRPVFFPSAPGWSPEEHGLERAIDALGWRCEVWCDGCDADEALDRLRRGLAQGPVLLGPLDFGYLSHFRGSGAMAGFDHYVVGLGLTDDGLVLHDPAGIPYAVLPLADLLPAWRADRIGYKRAPYTLRTTFQRVAMPSRQAMIERAWPLVRDCIRDLADGPRHFGGHRALSRLAAAMRTAVPEPLEKHLLGFSLPTAARRSVDAARFLAEADRPDAARLMRDEAVLWGLACSLAARGDWPRAAEAVDRLAAIDREVASTL